MLFSRPIFALFLAATALPAFGAQVIGIGSNHKSIAVTHDRIKFGVEDRVCIVQQRIEVVCGVVLKTTAKGAIIKLDTVFDNIYIGDYVRRAGNARQPAAQLMESAEFQKQGEKRIFAITGGVDVGPTFFFPLLHLQVAAFPKVSFGVQPLFFKGATADGSLTAFGGYATVNYYSGEYFQGLWVQGGAGMIFFSSTSTTGGTDESAAAPAGIATIGYRGNWELGLNVGIAAGFQFIKDPGFTQLEVKASGVHPLLMVDVGMSF